MKVLVQKKLPICKFHGINLNLANSYFLVEITKVKDNSMSNKGCPQSIVLGQIL